MLARLLEYTGSLLLEILEPPLLLPLVALETVAVPVSLVVGNLYVLLDRANIVVDELDEEDSL